MSALLHVRSRSSSVTDTENEKKNDTRFLSWFNFLGGDFIIHAWEVALMFLTMGHINSSTTISNKIIRERKSKREREWGGYLCSFVGSSGRTWVWFCCCFSCVFFKVLSLITIVCNRNDENLFMYFI